MNDDTTNILKAHKGLRQGDPLSPILFFIVMEYLHRILQKLKTNPKLNYHPKCEKFDIVNICFAYDLLLFVRGNFIFTNLVMSTFKVFSKATGLCANPTKCKVYFWQCG